MMRLLCLIVGYVFGLFQTGYIYGRIKNKDIRNYGSGNAGTTNALRVLGKKAGVIVFFGDSLKALFCCLLIRLIFKGSMPDSYTLMMLYAGLGVVLGHNYPFYLGFRGGKGIACTAGVIAALDWRITIVCFIAFTATVLATRIVSIGSLLVVSIFFVLWVVFGMMGLLPVAGAVLTESCIVVLIFAALGFWRHRANIKRLLNGTENKFGSKK